MKAEDTVMSKEQIREQLRKHPIYCMLPDHDTACAERELCLRQAEISFKAGYEKGTEFLDLTSETQYKAGIKVVIDWLETHCKGYHRGNHGGQYGHYGFYKSEWQSKLKEWGIE